MSCCETERCNNAGEREQRKELLEPQKAKGNINNNKENPNPSSPAGSMTTPRISSRSPTEAMVASALLPSRLNFARKETLRLREKMFAMQARQQNHRTRCTLFACLVRPQSRCTDLSPHMLDWPTSLPVLSIHSHHRGLDTRSRAVSKGKEHM